MEDDSAIRRLDEMGRLVIPKQMRRALRWQGGDAIVLTMTARDSLLLHRYPQLVALRGVAAGYADAFYRTYQVPVAISDREHLLAHRGFALAGQPLLSAALRRLLTQEEAIPLGASAPLLDGSALLTDVIIPVQPHAHPVGAVLLGNVPPLHRQALTEAALLLARMIASQML